uniref:zinc finger and BTB domain-containing protein 16-A n=1 Tax=Semicossyphus pulcher TaxID=241346 RepID=UPI0037E7726B
MIRINNTQYFHFLEQADTLRRSGSLCDAIISVKSQTFRAHRLVLACASRRLAQQLAQADIDSPVHCTLEYFSPRTFQQVLDFTYTQALEVSEEDLSLLLRAAQLLEMRPLEEQCQKQLDGLHCRARRKEITDVKEEEESDEEMDGEKKGGRVEEELRQDSSPGEEEGCSVMTENSSPSDPAKNNNSPSTIKKAKLSPVSYSRDKPKPVPSLHPPHAPRTRPSFSKLCNGLLSLSPTLHTKPLHWIDRDGEHHQARPVKKKKAQPERVRRGRSNQPDKEVPKASTGRVKSCQHCSASLVVNPTDSTSTPSGEACARCRFCGRAEVVQHEPQSHRQEHRGEKPYQCQRCPKKFSLKHQLDTHHRVHTGEKPFECRLCGQRSRDYSAMIKHLRTHGGAAPYQCTVCPEFCSSLVAMQRHIKSHAVQDFPPDWSISSTYLYTSHI